MNDSQEIHKSRWYRVTKGVHRGKEGVCDLIEDFPTGTLYRLNHPHLHEYVGRFHADELVETEPPSWALKVDPTEALSLMVKR